MNEVKVAIVGAGYMAQEHAKAFASLPGVRIVGVCSRTAARADALASNYGTSSYPTIDAMYAATRADIVVGAVPELSMVEVARTCFSFPWVCLLEKPVGLDLAQAQALLADSRERGARVFVALNRRSHAATRAALRELDADPSARTINILDQQDMAGARAMGQPEAVVVNYMYANSIHVVDYLQVFARGEIVRVDNIKPWTPAAPGLVVAALHYNSGDFALYQATWNGPGPWAVSISTEQLRLEMRPLEKLGVQRRGERRLTEVPGHPDDTDYKPGLRLQAQRLVNHLNGDPAGLATLEEATRSMRVVARIYGLDLADAA